MFSGSQYAENSKERIKIVFDRVKYCLEEIKKIED